MSAQPTTGRFLIREAVASDLPTLLEFRIAMMEAVFSDRPAPVSDEIRRDNERWLDEHFGRDFTALIADMDGHPVASAGLIWFEHPPGPLNPAGTEAYILNVYTRPEARRMGAARLLIEHLVAQARVAGVRRIWLRASDEGRPLYEAMGFGGSNYLQLKTDVVPDPPESPRAG